MDAFLSLPELQARRDRMAQTLAGNPGHWVRFIASARPEGAQGIFEEVPIIANVDGYPSRDWASVAIRAYRAAGWETNHIIRIDHKEP